MIGYLDIDAIITYVVHYDLYCMTLCKIQYNTNLTYAKTVNISMFLIKEFVNIIYKTKNNTIKKSL